MEWNWKFYLYILFLLFSLLFPVLSSLKVMLTMEETYLVIEFINEEAIACINEEAIGAINETAIGAIIAWRNSPSCFFILCFTVLLAPSINRPDFSNDFTISIMSSRSSFEINKVNPPVVLTAPCPFFFQFYLIQKKLLWLLI